MKETILVTGGAGFIGSNFVLDWLALRNGKVVNLDKLTYAGNMHNLDGVAGDPRHVFIRGDICDIKLLDRLFEQFEPRYVVHLAAESHVDRSIYGPSEFIQTNVIGTSRLLQSATTYWNSLSSKDRAAFRFLHVSTDEVFGSLNPDDPGFSETTPYAPNSPYSASKAGADHLVRAWCHTYGLPTMTTNCSNNYGPFQFPEKLIPLLVTKALNGEPLPIYGDGSNVRDWLHVGDHCSAIRQVLETGGVGQTYNIGGNCERTNLQVAQAICAILDELRPAAHSYQTQITFVKDRPGHDRRYAIDAEKIGRELGWRPTETFETGLRKTVAWYLGHQEWTNDIINGAYRNWLDRNYENRGVV